MPGQVKRCGVGCHVPAMVQGFGQRRVGGRHWLRPVGGGGHDQQVVVGQYLVIGGPQPVACVLHLAVLVAGARLRRVTSQQDRYLDGVGEVIHAACRRIHGPIQRRNIEPLAEHATPEHVGMVARFK